VRSPRYLLLAPALAAAILLAACGSGGVVVDADKAEIVILANLEQSTGTGISDVSCPAGVEVVEGARFTCTVTASDGAVAEAEIELQNDAADLRIVSLEKR
jgi:hypothetical protein